MLFDHSRDPSRYLGDPHANQSRWFLEKGVGAAEQFLKELKRHPEVEKVLLEKESESSNDPFGSSHSESVRLTLRFRNKLQIHASGVGSSATRVHAQTVAWAEMLERLGFGLMTCLATGSAARSLGLKPIFGTARPNTNGACFHSSPVSAINGAFLELVERDAFLAQWYSDKPFPVTRISDGHPLARRRAAFESQGWCLREHRWLNERVGATTVCLTLIRREPAWDQWNFMMGSAAGISYPAALKKALAEIAKAHGFYSAREISSRPKIPKNDLKTIEGRVFLSQRPSYVRQVLERMGPERAARAADRPGPSEERFARLCLEAYPEARIVPLPVPLALHDHVFCIKVVCEEMQDLDWEVPARVNLERVREAHGTQARRINRQLHPLA